eukprot:TRINITY_DN1125_c0_g2_i5.p1 TRINITY_DN1125_c0_g2~~TRINITY_DN1125_c0_g2_i5.p1  ORF type:complete len:739 (-),score=155.12 TRINITY_DN1125_c0_g2_i5:25-2166(-)
MCIRDRTESERKVEVPAELHRELEELRSMFGSIAREVQAGRSESTAIRGEIVLARNESVAARNESASVRAENDQVRGAIGNLQRQIDDLRRQVHSSEDELNSMGRRLEDEQNRSARAFEEVAGLKKKLEKVELNIEKFSSEWPSSFGQKIAALEAGQSRLFEEVKAKIDEISTVLAQQKDEVSRAELKQIRETQARASEELKMLNQKVGADAERLRSELHMFKTETIASIDRLRHLEPFLQETLEKNRASLQDEMNHLRRDFDTRLALRGDTSRALSIKVEDSPSPERELKQSRPMSTRSMVLPNSNMIITQVVASGEDPTREATELQNNEAFFEELLTQVELLKTKSTYVPREEKNYNRVEMLSMQIPQSMHHSATMPVRAATSTAYPTNESEGLNDQNGSLAMFKSHSGTPIVQEQTAKRNRSVSPSAKHDLGSLQTLAGQTVNYDRFFLMNTMGKVYTGGANYVQDDFKYACIRSKATLFENEAIQVGIITALAADQASLKISLHYSNKKNERMVDFTTFFHQKLVQVKNPMVNSQLEPLSQYKQELIIPWLQPRQNSYDVPMFEVHWRTVNNTWKFILPLPITINKFIVHTPEHDTQLRDKWKLYKANIFSSELRHLNGKFIKSGNDFAKYFPDIRDLLASRPKIPTSKNSSKWIGKYGGRFQLFGRQEFLYRILTRLDHSVVFQISSGKKEPEFSELFLNTFSFIFTK